MAKKSEETISEQKQLHIEIVRQMLTLATSGFGLVAALAWNSLIQTAINDYVKVYLPEGSGLLSMAIYAIIVTIVAVMVTLQLSRLLGRIEKQK